MHRIHDTDAATDLNMKKSWHPMLIKNQQQVWLKEKEAVSNYTYEYAFEHPLILNLRLARREEETGPAPQRA